MFPNLQYDFEDSLSVIYMSRHMGKPTICIGENKGADQLRSNCEADSAFVFAIWIVQFLYFLNSFKPGVPFMGQRQTE